MNYLRPIDLAREHGLSTQAIRNYEKDGYIPPAERTASGYRTYGPVHAAALRAYLALVSAHGHASGGQITRALNTDSVDAALAAIDSSHVQLLRDRATIDAVAEALGKLAPAVGPAPRQRAGTAALSIGELARRLDVTAVTLRNWERAGILAPGRAPLSGHRTYNADDLRDAELTRLLRRGGYRLEHIRTIVEQVRLAGGTHALRSALADWQHRLTTRGLAMLRASVELARYIDLLDLAVPGVRSEAMANRAAPAPTVDRAGRAGSLDPGVG